MTRDRDEQLERIIADYQQAQNSGQTIDEAALITSHPELAGELREFFAERGYREMLTSPLSDYAVAPQPVLRELQEFGDYQILEEIARGGMGIVYKARQISLNRIVAVKMILSGPLASETEIKRLQFEAESVANLQHPNIVAVHEAGRCDGHSYLTMEYIEGQTLSEIVREHPLPPGQAGRYVKEMAEAIHYAHQQGTLHRDLKPSNVLIDNKDRVRITDFGLAMRVAGDSELTQTGQILGTPSYMPPEQAQLQRELIGPASDIYSIGAVLYKLLTGRPPFQAETDMVTMWQLIETEPISPRLLNPAVPKDLETICLKCLEKEPHKRYATAEQLAHDLDRFLHGEPILARPIGRFARAWRWCRRHPSTSGMIASVALLVAGIFGGSLWYLHDRGERRAAEIRLETEREQRVARLEQGIEQALDRADALRKQSWLLTDQPLKWSAALQSARASYQQAASLLNQEPGSVSPVLIERLQKVDRGLVEDERDQKLAARYDEILMEMAEVDIEKSVFKQNIGPEKIREALAEYGVLVGETPVSELAARFNDRPATIQKTLVAALDLGLIYNPRNGGRSEEKDWLLSALRAVDSDPWRTTVRESINGGRGKDLPRLAREADLSAHPTSLLLVLSSALFRTGHKDEALSLLNRLHADRPDDFWVNQTAGATYSELKSPETAARFYQAALAIRPDNAGIWLNFGNSLLDAKNLMDAVSAYRKAIALQPKYAAAHYQLGLALDRQKKFAEAETSYRRALALNPHSRVLPFFLNNLGTNLMIQQKYTEAEACFRSSLRKNPNQAPVYFSLGTALRFHGMMSLELKRLRAAERRYAGALQLAPENSRYHLEMGILQADQNKLNEAVESFRRALELNPENAAAHVNLGVVQAILNQPDESERHLSRAKELKPDLPPGFFMMTFTLEKPEHVASALDVYRRLGKQYPNDLHVQCVLGNLLLRLHHEDEAIAYFQQCLKRRPDNFLAWFNLGRYFRDTGNVPAAIDCFQRAAELCPLNHLFQTDFVGTCFSAGKLPRAITGYEARIREWPVPKDTYLQLLSLLRYTGDAAGYRKWCRLMSDEFQDDPAALSEIVYAYVAVPEAGLPAELLESAKERLDSDNTFDLLVLGIAHLRLGQPQAAIADLESSLKTDGRSARRIQSRLYLALAQLKLGQTQQAQAAVREACSQSLNSRDVRRQTPDDAWDLQPWGAIPALWREVEQEMKAAGLDVPIPELPPAYERPESDGLDIKPLAAPRPDRSPANVTSKSP